MENEKTNNTRTVVKKIFMQQFVPYGLPQARQPNIIPAVLPLPYPMVHCMLAGWPGQRCANAVCRVCVCVCAYNDDGKKRQQRPEELGGAG